LQEIAFERWEALIMTVRAATVVKVIALAAVLAGSSRGTLLGQETAGAPQMSASEVLDRVRQTMAAISSIEYEYEWERCGVRAGAASNKSRYGNSGAFAYSGDKFFSEYFIINDVIRGHGYSAFDGDVYQELTGDLSVLSVSGNLWLDTPYVGVQPITKPWSPFLGSDQKNGLRIDIDTYRAPAIWGPIQERATLGVRQEISGHPCISVKFDKSRSNWELLAATDLEYYSIRLVTQWGEGEQRRRRTMDVEEVADLKTSRGRVIVPLRIRTVMRDALGTELSSELAKIDKASLKVNEPIENERFYLKRLMPMSLRYAPSMTPEQRERYEKGPN
jgi:hypothetical protein